ncbi:MAG: hypothetical protein ABIX28_13270 [Vicinamibacterales bacterium]
MRYRTLVFAACLLTLASAPFPRAQSPAAASARLEGDWVRIDPDGAGSFGGLAASIPPAQLLPGEAAAGGRGGRGQGGRGGPPGAQPTGPNPAGVPYVVVVQPCGGGGGGRSNGALLVNPDSGGVHVVEHKDEVIFAGERGGVRHFYMDGRAHPTPWTPTPAGHSVGRYEGITLVVETTGFTPGGVPGGGVRTAATVLVERFDLSSNGQRLTITYTWNDPKVYQKPHVYRYHFERAPTVRAGGAPVSYALEEWCDAGDPVEQQSIVPPKQIKK